MPIAINAFQNPYTVNYTALNRSASDNSAISGLPLNNVGNTGTDPKDLSPAQLQAAKKAGKIECKTCKNRTYQDGSNDPGVSFKTPGHIDPGSAASVVMAHEQEHVKNETAKAAESGRKVVSQSVTLQTGVCPECGRSYISGGLTKTVTKADNSKKDFFKDNFNKLIDNSFGKTIDVKL